MFLDTVRDLALRDVPWLPKIMEYGLYQSDLFIVQEYVDAASWRDLLNSKIDADAAYGVACDFLRAVDDMHSQSVSHGDLKPENVLFKINAETRQPVFVDLPDFAAK